MNLIATYQKLDAQGMECVVCFLFDLETLDPLAIGYAACSKKDEFNFQKGTDISYGRAKKALRTGRPNVTRAGKLRLVSRPLQAQHFSFAYSLDLGRVNPNNIILLKGAGD